MSLYYFDDEKIGLARETSHPIFVTHASADFYYDGMDEFAPFGSDTGNDTLRELEEWYQERGANAKAATWLRQLITAWGFGLGVRLKLDREACERLALAALPS